MFAGKPIIAVTGGIGSGKSFVASLFADEGCLVCDADASARAAYSDPGIRQSLIAHFGPAVFLTDGSPDRKLLADRVFNSAGDRSFLESLIHPFVSTDRNRLMNLHAGDPKVRAFLWDIPLLFEVGLDRLCDFIVFVDTPVELRQQRVAQSRHWPAGELERRENSQYPLDKKRDMSHYVIRNTADAGFARQQVCVILSQILAARSD
ncbi:MAG TPA: dephospho-CoA kinase [Tepidisphaeraceae bacterium]|jgi:dephospho-CoA kinase|nr:dephospho-CoA kinase [Tepidisphaeraceae bacterium]